MKERKKIIDLDKIPGKTIRTIWNSNLGWKMVFTDNTQLDLEIKPVNPKQITYLWEDNE